VHAGRDTLLNLLRHHGPADAALQVAAQAALQTVFDRCVTTLVSHFVAARESVIHGQAQSLLDMSTPVITLWESILLLPLVGVVDSVRAVQIAERLLETIGRTEAEVTLIDVTGVPVMDTSVARHLLRTVAAAEMLGTKVILTGISPTTAQTMVKLGIDLSAVPTRGSLKAGVALALRMTGRALPASGQPG
jgi:rsbT co-antagonist protein RsbR